LSIYFFDNRTIITFLGYSIVIKNDVYDGKKDFVINNINDNDIKTYFVDFDLKYINNSNITYITIGCSEYKEDANIFEDIIPKFRNIGIEVWTISKYLLYI
jgi:hypothetical protein